jgi:thioredoxin-like negative regulator of GroEL
VELEKARELSPTLSTIDFELARVLILQQQFADAFVAIERMPAGAAREQAIALAYHAPGHRSAADAALSRLIGLRSAPAADPLIELEIAEVYAFRGEREQALEWIARALERKDPEMPRRAAWVREELVLSPFLRVLHADARWSSLLASAR